MLKHCLRVNLHRGHGFLYRDEPVSQLYWFLCTRFCSLHGVFRLSCGGLFRFRSLDIVFCFTFVESCDQRVSPDCNHTFGGAAYCDQIVKVYHTCLQMVFVVPLVSSKCQYILVCQHGLSKRRFCGLLDIKPRCHECSRS